DVDAPPIGGNTVERAGTRGMPTIDALGRRTKPIGAHADQTVVEQAEDRARAEPAPPLPRATRVDDQLDRLDAQLASALDRLGLRDPVATDAEMQPRRVDAGLPDSRTDAAEV